MVMTPRIPVVDLMAAAQVPDREPTAPIDPGPTCPLPPVRLVLRATSMVGVPPEPGEQVDQRWVDRMRVPYTNQARHLVERALYARAMGPPPIGRHRPDAMPTWAREAAARHRGVLDALGVDLAVGTDVPAGPGEPVLIQHLVPAISLGSYLVTTVYATGDSVLMIQGVYAEHHVDEAPFPVRWS